MYTRVGRVFTRLHSGLGAIKYSRCWLSGVNCTETHRGGNKEAVTGDGEEYRDAKPEQEMQEAAENSDDDGRTSEWVF